MGRESFDVRFDGCFLSVMKSAWNSLIIGPRGLGW